MEEKIVTIDELWVEFEKAIKYGGFSKFKTKEGMIEHVKKCANSQGGKELVFSFKTGTGYNFLRCRLKIKKEWIENDKNKKRNKTHRTAKSLR